MTTGDTISGLPAELVQLAAHQCSSPSGDRFYAFHFRWYRTRGSGKFGDVRIIRVSSGGQCSNVKLTLSFSDRFFNLIIDSWPPEELLGLSWEPEGLALYYADTGVPDEKPILPFGLDRDSVWRAVYVEACSRWRLSRLQGFDDIPGLDGPIEQNYLIGEFGEQVVEDLEVCCRGS